LKPTFEKAGIPPNKTGFAYSSPTIRLPSGEYTMESRAIADVLENKYPTPTLHLDSPYLPRVEDLMSKILPSFRGIFVPLVPKVFLNPRSQEFFVSDREKTLGMSLDEFAKNGNEMVKQGAGHVKELGEVYKENKDGPFVLGKEVSYADFIVAAWAKMMVGLGEEEALFGLEGGKEIKAVYEACQAWFSRDST
jgi:glutathione S-transferase